jgi:hypothetical protein
MAILNIFKLGFKVDNDCGLMVEGGGFLHRRRGAWRLGCGGTNQEAAGLSLAARPEEDEGGRAPVVRERRGGIGLVGRGVGWWAGRLGPASRPRPKEWVGRLEKKRKRKSIKN